MTFDLIKRSDEGQELVCEKIEHPAERDLERLGTPGHLCSSHKSFAPSVAVVPPKE